MLWSLTHIPNNNWIWTVYPYNICIPYHQKSVRALSSLIFCHFSLLFLSSVRCCWWQFSSSCLSVPQPGGGAGQATTDLSWPQHSTLLAWLVYTHCLLWRRNLWRFLVDTFTTWVTVLTPPTAPPPHLTQPWQPPNKTTPLSQWAHPYSPERT